MHEPHESAGPFHYDESAENYDVLNEEKSHAVNQNIARILKEQCVKTVVDLTCGTGSQVIYLSERGYDVTGSDISSKMIAHAKKKGVSCPLHVDDIRTARLGTFDAALSIFNAIGHLTKCDFEKALQNIQKNLNPHGLFVFDIFNRNYLLECDNITKLTIDWMEKKNRKTVRKIQFSTIDINGILSSYTTQIVCEGNHSEVSKSEQTLQVYSADELKELLDRNGFDIIEQTNIDGAPFFDRTTERILSVGRKK